MHHNRALRLLAAAIGLDIVLGTVFGFSAHIGVFEGIYYATGTATTVGADRVPQGLAQHVLTLGMMVTIIPLFGAVLALLTTGLTADHVDARHEAMKKIVKGE